MNNRIRKFTTADIPAIHNLILEFAAFQKTPEKVKVTVEQMYADADIFQCLVAEAESGELVGYACYYFAYYSWSGKALYLDDLYVREANRGAHIGQSFLDALIAEAKSSGCKKMRWQVSKWNEKAIGFYHKRGATTDDTEMNCDLTLNVQR